MELVQRTKGVVYRSVGDEIVVLRADTSQAFGLTPSAAAVFAECETPVTTAQFRDRTGLTLTEIEGAVDALAQAGLVSIRSAGMSQATLSRRRMLISGAAFGAAAVTAIALPTAAAAASGASTSPGGGSGTVPTGGTSPVSGETTTVAMPSTSSGSGTTPVASGTTGALNGATAEPSSLAYTGSPVGKELGVAAALIGAGAVAVAASRPSRSSRDLAEPAP